MSLRLPAQASYTPPNELKESASQSEERQQYFFFLCMWHQCMKTLQMIKEGY